MKRLALLLPLLALAAGAVWLVARGGGARRDPVERLVAEMVQIPGRDFRMGKYEVTQAQWEAVMGENHSLYKGADHPVENVSWDDCQAFLEKLNAHPAARASGLVFRLPTEEEWETACRAGSTNAYCRLADGTEITEATLGRVAWYVENASTRPRWLARFLAFAERFVDRVHEVDWSETLSHKPVGRKEPNAWGLHDMHGNVWEWTETATLDRKYFFRRSGGWRCPAWGCAVNAPSGLLPSDRESDTGFRLCASGRADTAPTSQASGARDGGASRAERGGDSGPSEASAHAESAAPAEPKPHAESALHRGHDPRPRLAAEDNEVAGQRVEDLVQLPEALAQIGRRRRVLGFRLCATQSPAAEETHAESAESAEPVQAKPAPPLGGDGERSGTEGVSHAENAETAELAAP